MKKLNKDLFGWMVAAILAGILASAGFQGATESVAVVDLQKVIKSSDFYKLKEAEFQGQLALRNTLLKFINDNRVISAEQWPKLRDLSLKDKPTDAEKGDLQKLQATITDQSKKLVALQGKQGKTADDVTLMEEYQRWVQQVQVSATSLQDQIMNQELPGLQAAAAKAVEDKAREAVQAIGKEQGYTIVYDTLAAPYGAHDLTTDSLARMNKH
ncbi:MAG TPA: OmpH family outer membrane protein [Fimbriimonadaceae bacterium]|nr:OmpH family outer membrane protein [Fimbriimonadaceae bacterium]